MPLFFLLNKTETFVLEPLVGVWPIVFPTFIIPKNKPRMNGAFYIIPD